MCDLMRSAKRQNAENGCAFEPVPDEALAIAQYATLTLYFPQAARQITQQLIEQSVGHLYSTPMKLERLAQCCRRMGVRERDEPHLMWLVHEAQRATAADRSNPQQNAPAHIPCIAPLSRPPCDFADGRP